MAVTLVLREAPVVSLDAEAICPDRLIGLSRTEIEKVEVWHGRDRAALGEFFAVSGTDADDLHVEGDLRAVNRVGAATSHGRLTIAGAVGMHLGADMRGGEIVVDGDAGDWAGAAMCGGRLIVRGSVGAHAGAAHPGARVGMRAGELLVSGDAGEQAGAAMRRGLIAVAGRLGDAVGLRMLAGTIVGLGGVGSAAGAGMRRGTIVTMLDTTLLPTFRFACVYRPVALRLYLRRLRRLGLTIPDEQIEARYARWSGDGLELNRGEILILEGAR